MLKKRFFESGNARIEYAIRVGTIGSVAMGGLALLGFSLAGSNGLAGKVSTATPNPVSISVITATVTATPTPAPTAAVTPIVSVGRAKEIVDEVDDDTERERGPSNYFYDDFNDGDTDGWFAAKGSDWHLEQDRYCAGPVRKEHRSFAGDSAWTDYTVTTTAELSRGKGYGVYFRATNAKNVNAYVFQYDPGYSKGAFLFRQVVNGREKRPFAINRVRDYDWYHQSSTVSVKVQGNTFTAYVDGQEVLKASHDAFKTGQSGLRNRRASSVCFDDMTVTPLAETGQSNSVEDRAKDDDDKSKNDDDTLKDDDNKSKDNDTLKDGKSKGDDRSKDNDDKSKDNDKVRDDENKEKDNDILKDGKSKKEGRSKKNDDKPKKDG